MCPRRLTRPCLLCVFQEKLRMFFLSSRSRRLKNTWVISRDRAGSRFPPVPLELATDERTCSEWVGGRGSLRAFFSQMPAANKSLTRGPILQDGNPFNSLRICCSLGSATTQLAPTRCSSFSRFWQHFKRERAIIKYRQSSFVRSTNVHPPDYASVMLIEFAQGELSPSLATEIYEGNSWTRTKAISLTSLVWQIYFLHAKTGVASNRCIFVSEKGSVVNHSSFFLVKITKLGILLLVHNARLSRMTHAVLTFTLLENISTNIYGPGEVCKIAELAIAFCGMTSSHTAFFCQARQEAARLPRLIFDSCCERTNGRSEWQCDSGMKRTRRREDDGIDMDFKISFWIQGGLCPYVPYRVILFCDLSDLNFKSHFRYLFCDLKLLSCRGTKGGN